MQNTLTPVKLVPGDLIGIIAPASPLFGEKKKTLDKGIDYLKARGYQVCEGDHVRSEYGYLAGTDAERLKDLNGMLRDPHIKAVFCARGGYGTPRLLSQIDYKAVLDNPKIIVGYSDITSLQLALYAKAGLKTFSGPMVAVEMGKSIDPMTEDFFWTLITQAAPLRFDDISDQWQVIHPGRAQGRLFGGCFSLINPLIGTPYLPDLEGAILVLEDIGEDVYRLDRYFAQMQNAGILDKISGLIFGDFIDCEKNGNGTPSLSVDEMIRDFTRDLHIPIISGFPYGHGDKKFTLPIGCQVVLDTTEKTLTMTEAGVRDV